MALLYINSKFGKVVVKKNLVQSLGFNSQNQGVRGLAEENQKKPQNLGTNQTKNVNDLCNENDKTSLQTKETKENTHTNTEKR